MTQADLLLKAIIACPDDNLARLAYADRLEEDGQMDRAEFVRVQVAREHCPHLPVAKYGEHAKDCPCGWCVLGRREIELVGHADDGLRLDGCLWLVDAAAPEAMIRGEGGSPLIRLTFRRGFVSSVRCTLADWQSHGPAVCAAHPVEEVSLTDREALEVFGGDPVPQLKTAAPFVFSRLISQDNDHAHKLPGELFDLLPAGSRGWGPHYALFDSAEAARKGLSVALILWARSQEPAAV